MNSGLSQKDKDGLKIIVVCSIIFIFMGILTYILGAKENIDDETLCLLDEPLTGHTVFFVDRTDPLNKEQTEWLLREVERSKLELRSNEKLSIFAIIGSTDSFLRTLFSRCSPGSGKEANPLYQNPKKIQKKFEESFGEPLAKILEGLTQGSKYPISPIMESIKNLSKQKEFSSSINNRKLYIVSDMLQNTHEFSQYHAYSFKEFEKSDYFENVKPDLVSVEVRMYYIANNYQKARNIQNEDHRKFWKDYFKKIGAKNVELIPISYLPFEAQKFKEEVIENKKIANKIERKSPVGEPLLKNKLNSLNKNDSNRQPDNDVEDNPKTDDLDGEEEAPKSELKDQAKSKNNQNNDGVGEIVRRNFIGSFGNKKSISMEICFFLRDGEFRGRFKERNAESWVSLRGIQAGKEKDYLISLNSLLMGKSLGLFTGKYDPKKGVFMGEYKSAITNETADFRLFEKKEDKGKDHWSVSIEKLECISF